MKLKQHDNVADYRIIGGNLLWPKDRSLGRPKLDKLDETIPGIIVSMTTYWYKNV